MSLGLPALTPEFWANSIFKAPKSGTQTPKSGAQTPKNHAMTPKTDSNSGALSAAPDEPPHDPANEGHMGSMNCHASAHDFYDGKNFRIKVSK